jgi:orotate phosphoribosyltransferase-like protein
MANDNDNDNDVDIRGEMLALLMDKVSGDRYPSSTMMDMIEQLMQPDELPTYAAILMDKIQQDTYPSIPMMRRVMRLG